MTARVLRSVQRVGLAALIVLVLAAVPMIVYGTSATYEHDTKGRVSKITYDDGTVVDYAYDLNGNRTSAIKTTPPPDMTPPSAPGTPSVSSITMTSAHVSWTAATDNESVVGYDYRLNAGSWQSLSNVLFVNLTGLSPATTYNVQVRARDAASNLGPASSRSFATPDTAAPSAPTALTASAPTSTTVNLSWHASSDNVGVTGYRIYRNGAHIADRSTTSYTNSGLTGSTTYSYQVRAYDAATNLSGASNTATVTTPDTIAPSKPTGLSATAVSPSRINLSWGASSDSGGSGLAGYRVYRNGAPIANTSARTYANTGLTGSTTYSYTVAAYDHATNQSGQSNTASDTTWPALTATVNDGTWRWLRRGSRPTQVDPPVVVTASGGSGTGYTYAWQYVSGDTATSVVSPTSNSTRWSRSVPNSNATYTSTWRCVVTDSTGNTTAVGVTVTFIRTTLQ